MTFDGFPAAAPVRKVLPAMKTSRRPSLQDACLAAVLLAATWAVGGLAGRPLTAVGVVVCVAAVAVRRSLPVSALIAASLAAFAQMALAAGPVPADLAVPIAVYTVAAHRRPKLSLALLATTLAVAAAWSAYVSLDGETDGWTPGVGGSEVSGGPSGGGPTAWGGPLVVGSLLLVAWAIGWGMRSRRAYLAELAARARDRESERERQAVAAERSRITRELHDVVAHGLAVIVMQAQGGAAAFAKRPFDTLAALDTIVATGRASLADMRHVLSDSGEIGGLSRLPDLVDQVRQAGTPVELRVDGSPRALPGDVEASAYRIVQEALTNTLKHAGPGARARVVVTYGEELAIEIGDDGRSTTGTGNGLRGMRERVALLGGEVTTGPGPDGGYLVRARIPLGEPA